MKNYLLPHLENYFEEILQLEGNLNVTEVSLNYFKTEMKAQNTKDRNLIQAITSYRDLSQLTPGDNLYTPDFAYTCNVKGLDATIEEALSHHCGTTVSQAYEVFESFLIEIITEFLFRNQEKLVTVKLLKAHILLDKKTIREMVKKKSGVNNKGLLNLVRKLSLHFQAHESKNIHKVAISQWFDLVSMVRHTLTHNRQKVSHRFLNYLSDNKANKLFDRHFKRKRIGNDVYIFLEKDITIDILNWLNSYAHLVFKGMSLDNHISIKVPQYMPPPLIGFRL